MPHLVLHSILCKPTSASSVDFVELRFGALAASGTCFIYFHLKLQKNMYQILFIVFTIILGTLMAVAVQHNVNKEVEFIIVKIVTTVLHLCGFNALPKMSKTQLKHTK